MGTHYILLGDLSGMTGNITLLLEVKITFCIIIPLNESEGRRAKGKEQRAKSEEQRVKSRGRRAKSKKKKRGSFNRILFML